MNPNRSIRTTTIPRDLVNCLLAISVMLLASCISTPPVRSPTLETVPAATVVTLPDGLTSEQAATLASLRKLDGYPLYTMHYYGPLLTSTAPGTRGHAEAASASMNWACSLFAALGDPDHRLFGRNFDWRFSPALLLFTEPPDGYASVSMVDLEYFGFSDRTTGQVLDPIELSLPERRRLLETPSMPFDGMNSAGVAIGMAAVPQADEQHEPGRWSIDSISIIREVLDHAGNVEEAVEILKAYNIDWAGGPPLHYLVADRTGHAGLVEFWKGQSQVVPPDGSWHAATNFTRSAVDGSAAGQCMRYDALAKALTEADGRLTTDAALSLLQRVAQRASPTQWSVVYDMNRGVVNVVMGQRYDRVHTRQLLQSRPQAMRP